MDVILGPLLGVLMMAVNLYTYIVIGSVIFSWLYSFRILNPGNPVVDGIGGVLFRLTDPILSYFRRFLPNLSGLDLSPVVLLFVLYFLGNMLARLAMRFSL